MKMGKFLKAMFAVGVVAACAGMLAACSGGEGAANGSGVAATVNGTEILEETVTATVENVRAQSGLEDEESWANFLIENDMTPESVREQILESLENQELVKAGATSLGLVVDSTEVDTYVESMKANFDSDEAWAEALEQAGFTEDKYRENIESSLLQQQLNTYFQDNAEVSDEELLESANDYASYYDGAKRSSHILFGVDDTSDEAAMKEAREKAQKILDQINDDDDADFGKLAKENSTDTTSAENEGDVGWDVLNSFVAEYTDALDELDKGEVSGLVESQYGIHIIKCTDVFNAPEKVEKITDLPEDFQSTIEDMAKSVKANDDYTAWLDEQRDSATIEVNDMPADVPYNVDLTKYQSDEGDDESADGEEGEDSENADGEEADSDEDGAEEIEVEAVDASDEADDDVIDVEVEEPSDESAEAEASDEAEASGEADSADEADEAADEAKKDAE